tara:strand:- start:1608 stop:1865 length:258 start_codon:yes stop_codon:yes gene_type:complete
MLEILATLEIALGQKDMMNLICLHGVDWVYVTESFDGLDKHLKRKSRELFPESMNVRSNLYWKGVSCARQQAKEMGIEIPEQYMP